MLTLLIYMIQTVIPMLFAMVAFLMAASHILNTSEKGYVFTRLAVVAVFIAIGVALLPVAGAGIVISLM